MMRYDDPNVPASAIVGIVGAIALFAIIVLLQGLFFHMEREEYEVWEAENGHKAQDIIKSDPNWSLVILDLKMPGIDGREVLQFIRGSASSVAIPVMIRTGTGSDHTEAELLEAGADDYVPKSMDPARFMARVRAVLRRSLL